MNGSLPALYPHPLAPETLRTLDNSPCTKRQRAKDRISLMYGLFTPGNAVLHIAQRVSYSQRMSLPDRKPSSAMDFNFKYIATISVEYKDRHKVKSR